MGMFPRVTHPSATDTEVPVRLACVKPAASVRSEPGSNSQVEEPRKAHREFAPDSACIQAVSQSQPPLFDESQARPDRHRISMRSQPNAPVKKRKHPSRFIPSRPALAGPQGHQPETPPTFLFPKPTMSNSSPDLHPDETQPQEHHPQSPYPTHPNPPRKANPDDAKPADPNPRSTTPHQKMGKLRSSATYKQRRRR